MLADVHQPQFNIWAWQKAHLNPVFDITRVLAEVKDRLTSYASIRITMVAAIWDRSMCLFLLMQLKLYPQSLLCRYPEIITLFL